MITELLLAQDSAEKGEIETERENSVQCIWKGRRCYKEHQKQQWCWAADAGGEAKDYTLGPRLELILSRVYILVQRVGLFLFSRRPGYLVLAPIPGLSLESANVSSLCPRTFGGGCAKPEAKVQMVAKHSRWPHDNFSGAAPKLERYETEREREREKRMNALWTNAIFLLQSHKLITRIELAGEYYTINRSSLSYTAMHRWRLWFIIMFMPTTIRERRDYSHEFIWRI